MKDVSIKMVAIDMKMPLCCYECELYDDTGDYPRCFFTGLSEGYSFNYRSKRMAKCPLKEIKKTEYYQVIDSHDFQKDENPAVIPEGELQKAMRDVMRKLLDTAEKNL